MVPDETAQPPAWGWVRQFFQYGVVGGMAAVCDLAVFNFLTDRLEINYLAATTASFIVGTTINFFLALKFVFHLTGHSPVTALWRKFFSSLGALVISLIAMFVMVDIFAFDQMNFGVFGASDGLLLARGLTICLTFSINFVLTKYYVFRDY